MDFYKAHTRQGMPQFDDAVIRQISRREDYIVTPALERAVNMALYLGQPLLLTGEPGTGKTELAAHLASHFAGDDASEVFFRFNTKTTSTATDLFYRYDSLRHFQYAQNNQVELGPEEVEKRFVHYQALGAAIRSGRRCIVLIDEIDKAPRDLPNDILDVLESLSFEVPELGYVGNAAIRTAPENRPLAILTSNSEKNLPDAFLRRCVFYHIPFPDDALLTKILMGKTTKLKEPELAVIVAHFRQLREACRRKPPATAELLQWMVVLEKLQAAGRLRISHLEEPSEEEAAVLRSTYSVLVKDKEDMKGL